MGNSILAAGTGTDTVDFGPSIQSAKDTALGLLQDNVLLLLAVPVAWVGYKMVKKVIARIAG